MQKIKIQTPKEKILRFYKKKLNWLVILSLFSLYLELCIYLFVQWSICFLGCLHDSDICRYRHNTAYIFFKAFIVSLPGISLWCISWSLVHLMLTNDPKRQKLSSVWILRLVAVLVISWFFFIFNVSPIFSIVFFKFNFLFSSSRVVSSAYLVIFPPILLHSIYIPYIG